MPATLDDIVGHYVDRLIYQYRSAPRARATVALVVKQALGDDLPRLLVSAYNVDQAVGRQLDVIAKYVGVPRNIGSVRLQGYFGFFFYASTLDLTKYQGPWDPATDLPAVPAAAGGNAGYWYVASKGGNSTSPIAAEWLPGDILVSDGAAWSKRTTENGNGFTTYNDLYSNINGIFYSYATAQLQATDLPDDVYRLVIKLKIMQNSNDSTLASIVAMLQLFFPGLMAVNDNRNMTIDYYVNTLVPLTRELLLAYLPRPMGVGINLFFVSPSPAGGDHLITEGGDTLTTEGGDPLTVET